jgi:hypothetical protein
MILYEVIVNETKYRIVSSTIGAAVKRAVDAAFDGQDEPADLSVTVRARAVPTVERIG